MPPFTGQVKGGKHWPNAFLRIRMSGNSFGERFRITTFGESHGLALGAIVDGCPPGLEISEEDL